MNADAFGPEPSREELAAAQALGRRARQDAMRVVLADALTLDQTARRLGSEPAEVTRRVSSRKLIAFGQPHDLRLPAWQFTATGTLPALAELIAAWPGTALSLCTFAVRPSVDLAGRTPAQDLTRAGGPARVLDLVAATAAAAQ